MMRLRRVPVWAVAAAIACGVDVARSAADDAPASISEAVRPILARCVACHRGDEPAGGLDLSKRESAVEGGESGPALNPGHPAESLMFRRVKAGKMPPKKPLDPEQVALLEKWIASGATWDGPISADLGERWAMEPLERPEVPASDGTVHPIDAFIRQRLAREGLSMSPPADARTLARRLSFDLTGMPPSPEEMDRFLADTSPRAYESLVDRLLASPRYGERWARHWLDVARFGESDGFEYDKIRPSAWNYRDYVIRSLNEDRPYAQFVRDQIDGDVRPDATPETIAATGFLVAGPWDEANNIQASATMRARTREEELEDMVAAVGQTFLGVTVNCARCHDHKFDPILQKDYYRFASALAGVKHGERPALGPVEIAAREAKRAALKAEVEQADRKVKQIERAGHERVRGAGKTATVVGPLPLIRWSFDGDASSDGAIESRLEGGATISSGSLHLSGNGAFLVAAPLPHDLQEKTLEAWVRVADFGRGGGAALSIQKRGGGQFDAIVFGEREPKKWMAGSEGFGRSKNLDAPTETPDPMRMVHLAISYAADGTIQVFRDGLPYGPAYQPEKAPRTYPAAETEILIGLRHTGAGNGFFAGDVEEARIYDRALSAQDVAVSFKTGPGGVSLAEAVAALSPEEKAKREEAIRHREERARALRAVPPVPKIYAASPVEVGATHVLLRGDVEKPGPEIAAGGLSAIARPSPDLGLAPDAPEAERRRKLADWIADRENPLTYRAMANRLWHYHFGVGIVGTPNDLGASGERPSHPELLDWLACELRDGGRLKALHRRIVTSETYRQSSRFDARAAAKDADARLLWRFPPKRLEGEAVRDAMLASSGNLNPAMYGPSFRPFTVKYFDSSLYTLTDPIGPEFDRRTIYRIHVLSAKSPLLDALDCPDPATKTPRRGVTTTPLQALAMMNDTFVTRQSKGLSDRTLREAGDDLANRIDLAYRIALGRPPTDAERDRVMRLAKSHGMDEVAWTLLNATEFVYVY